MKSAPLNFRRPPNPIKLEPSIIWKGLGFALTILASAGGAIWITSAYKADYDTRLARVERDVAGFQSVPSRLSSIEGKVDVILNNILRK